MNKDQREDQQTKKTFWYIDNIWKHIIVNVRLAAVWKNIWKWSGYEEEGGLYCPRLFLRRVFKNDVIRSPPFSGRIRRFPSLWALFWPLMLKAHSLGVAAV